MRSRGRCSGSGRRAGLRRSNAGTVIFSLAAAAAICAAASASAGVLFQLGKLQLELLEQRAALRGLPEPLVPQLGDRELELLDQQRAVLRLALAPPPCLRRAAPRRASIAFSVARSSGSESVSAHRRRCESQSDLRCVSRTIARRFTMPRSAGRLRSPRVLRHPPVDPFQQIAELRRRDRHRAIRRRRPDEAAALQPLREQAHALAVVPQHLDQAAAPAAEHEQMPAVRIAPERLLHQQRQAVKALAHVGVAGRQPHPHAARNRDHRRRLRSRQRLDQRRHHRRIDRAR